MIVAENLKDFPPDALSAWDVEAKSPDDFVSDQIHLDASVVYGEVVRIADLRKRSMQTVDDVLDQLERSGLVSSVALLRRP